MFPSYWIDFTDYLLMQRPTATLLALVEFGNTMLTILFPTYFTINNINNIINNNIIWLLLWRSRHVAC